MKDDKIIIFENGEPKEYQVLFKFDLKDTDKSYVGYTDDSLSNQRKNIFISKYKKDTYYEDLEDIINEDEINMVERVLETIDQRVNND